MLKIKNLQTKIDDKPILKGIDIKLEAGKIHAIMGPNGSGKSTLAYTIMGHPSHVITKGSITYNGRSINKLAPDERSKLGIFLSFQNPHSLPGIKVSTMLRTALNEHLKNQKKEPISVTDFILLLREAMKILDIPTEFASRCVNDGFSGGERKRLEILQALILKPKLLILDEVDSGLDVDAIKLVAKGVNQLQNNGAAVFIITHYQRILYHIKPDVVHILDKGKIVKSGDISLVEKIEQSSYQEAIAA